MNEEFIVSVPYSRVRNLEYPGFMNDVQMIVAKHGAAKYFVDGQYNIMLGIQVTLNALVIAYRKLPKTDELVELRDKRSNMISAVLRQTKTIQKANLASQADSLILVTPFLNRYLTTIQDSNTKLKREHIRQLGNSMDDNAPLQAALEELGLKLYVNELRIVQNNIDLTFGERIELLAEVPMLDTKGIIGSSIAALKNMFKAIELASLEHPDLDYGPLVNELNQFLVLYKAQIKARTTRNKTASINAAAVAKIATESTSKPNTVAI